MLSKQIPAWLDGMQTNGTPMKQVKEEPFSNQMSAVF